MLFCPFLIGIQKITFLGCRMSGFLGGRLEFVLDRRLNFVSKSSCILFARCARISTVQNPVQCPPADIVLTHDLANARVNARHHKMLGPLDQRMQRSWNRWALLCHARSTIHQCTRTQLHCVQISTFTVLAVCHAGRTRFRRCAAVRPRVPFFFLGNLASLRMIHMLPPCDIFLFMHRVFFA